MSGESQGAATEKGIHADLSMPQILLGYGETFDALHMILESAPPVAVEYNAKRILKMIADALERDLAVPARDEVREFFAHNVRDSPRNDAGATNVPPEVMESLVDELAELTYESSRPDGETWLPRFSIAMYRAGVRPRPESLVAEILVVMAVSAFHTLLASVARTVFLLNPGRLSGGKEVSLGDILDLGSLDRVVEVAIQRKVDSFLREDLAFWANWYTKRVVIKLTLPLWR